MSRDQPALPHRSCVAIVDDDPDQRLLLRHALELRGCRVLEFESTEAALGWDTFAEGADRPPIAEADLILLDINLPGVSGVEALQMLKETPSLRKIPVAMLTAERTSDVVFRCVRAGACDYFAKPLDLPEIMRRIDRVLMDPSGLLTRTGAVELKWSFQEFLIRELKKSERTEAPLALLLGGIRQVPISTGPLALDVIQRIWEKSPSERTETRQALETFLRQVRRNLREYDVLVPFGTAEFVGLLPGTHQLGADAVVRKLEAAFQKATGLPPHSRREQWGLLMGSAVFPEDGRDRLSLFSAAETRLSDRAPSKPHVHQREDRIFPKTIRCAACGCHFTYPRIVGRRIVPAARDSDFRMIFEGFEPLYYGVVTCTTCGLSALEPDVPSLEHMSHPAFGWSYQARQPGSPLTKPTLTVIPEELRDHLSPPYEAWIDKEPLPSDLRSLVQRIEGSDRLLHLAASESSLQIGPEKAAACHLLGRETYRIAGASPLRRARFSHRLAWLHRIGGDTGREKEFLAEALGFYLTAFHFEDLSASKPSEIEIFYLLGEISFRLGRESDAIAIFDRLVRDPRLEDKPSFRKMVRRRWFEARHEPPDESSW